MLQKQQLAQYACFSEYVIMCFSLEQPVLGVTPQSFDIELAIAQASSAPATCCIACGATLPIAVTATRTWLLHCSIVAIYHEQDPWFQSDTDAPLPKENLARLVPGAACTRGGCGGLTRLVFFCFCGIVDLLLGARSRTTACISSYNVRRNLS